LPMTPAVIALRYSAPLGAIEAAAAVMPFPRIFAERPASAARLIGS
jgi:hypothetical protein